MSQELVLRIRKLLWIYFWLLIFEGALRRWFLPQLSTPLIFVREPVAIYVLWLALPTLLRRKWIYWLLFIFPFVLISTIFTMLFAHADPIIAFVGFSTYLIQLPLIFVFGLVFTLRDVFQFSKMLLLLSIPMSILFVFQSYLPSTHILNVGPGGVGTSVFAGVKDNFRPPAIFTFINQVASYYTISCSSFFIIAFSPFKFKYKNILLCLSAVSLLVALPFSISRIMLLGYGTVVSFTILSLLLAKRYIRRLLRFLIIGIVIITLSFSFPAIQDATTVFNTRLEYASKTESTGYGSADGLGPLFRIMSYLYRPFNNVEQYPLFGHGIGIGTRAASTLLRNPNSTNSYYILNQSKFTPTGFLVGESSWDSTVGEMGVLGYFILFWRSLFALYVFMQAFKCSLRGNIYPLILYGSVFHSFFWGWWGQASALGFVVFSMGLTLSSMNSLHPSTPILKR